MTNKQLYIMLAICLSMNLVQWVAYNYGFIEGTERCATFKEKP